MSKPARPRSSSYARPTPTAHVAKAAVPSAPAEAKQKRQIVGQYMLGKTIGEGTFGKVKLAVHIPTGEKVAIKILEKGRIKEQADVRRVNREIKILKKARHGNVIQLFEVLDTRTHIFLIMECAEGGEMFDYIVAQKRVEEVQACKFFHQIINGLEVLHHHDITHRDLKPENLLLKATEEGWLVKIVDFGLSNTHEGGKLLTTACGSPCYAAPEMIAGKKYVGPLADLWSTGVILFALVSGYLPFEDANTSVLYKKILSGDYACPKWLSPQVVDLLS
ncbi:kinase-like domain-containing protein, partial [Ochromonadaceae sp. CCMP2298]